MPHTLYAHLQTEKHQHCDYAESEHQQLWVQWAHSSTVSVSGKPVLGCSTLLRHYSIHLAGKQKGPRALM